MRYNTTMPYTISECDTERYSSAMRVVAKTLDEPLPFLQAPFYGHLQAASGKTVVYFLIERDKAIVGCGIGIVYEARGLRFLYCPYGPVCSSWDTALLQALETFFKPIAARLDCSFVRIDATEASTFVIPIATRLASTASLQPRAEWMLNISPDEDTIWMGFHKHARYNVRLAERANAEIQLYKPSEAPLDVFFSLMQATGRRDSFGIFDKSYYDAYLQTLTDADGFVIICKIEGKPAAAGLFAVFDGQAHYVFAGSSNDFRKIAPAYAVIWTAIREAKRRGCNLFNFGGVIDEVKGQDLSGVTSFKKRFGGYRAEHPNPVDLVFRRLRYNLFKLYKTLR